MQFADLVTKADLTKLRQLIIGDFERIIKDNLQRTKEWLRTKEACAFLNVSTSTLQNYRERGILTPKKVEGTLYYSRKELSNLFNQ